MDSDALVLALLAIADLAFLVHLRLRHAQRVRRERMMASLKYAVQRANSVEETAVRHQLPQAS